jgi:hypothetical protein
MLNALDMPTCTQRRVVITSNDIRRVAITGTAVIGASWRRSSSAKGPNVMQTASTEACCSTALPAATTLAQPTVLGVAPP